MDDFLGLGKSTDKLIGAVERALGAVYRTLGVRREADAEDHRIRVVEGAKTDVKARDIVVLARAKAEAKSILVEEEKALEARLRARERYMALKEQKNLEQVIAGAMAEPVPSSDEEKVDDDWMTDFFQHAKGVSGADMQALWSRVLALEVGVPGTFSSKALEVLKKMTHREAIAFQAACRLAASHSPESERLTIIDGAFRETWHWYSESPEIPLGEFDLSFLERTDLIQLGLIYDKLVTKAFTKNESCSLFFPSAQINLRVKNGGVRLRSYLLTPVGFELSALVTEEQRPDYISKMCTSLSKFFHVSILDSQTKT